MRSIIHFEALICMDVEVNEKQFEEVNSYVQNDLASEMEEVLWDEFRMNQAYLSVTKQDTSVRRSLEPQKEEQQ